MILRLLTKPLQALRKSLSTPKAGGGDKGGGAAADPRREWEEQLDAWLATLKTDPNASEALAFLQRLLRQTATDPLDAVEVSAAALYDTFAESVVAGDLAFFVERIVATHTEEELARARDYITCLAKLYGEDAPAAVLPLVADRRKAIEEQRLATVLGTETDTGQAVAIPFEARFQGVAAFGATGTGKTTTQFHMVLSDICAGHCIVLIEPHGDLVRNVLAAMPEERLKDVVYLDITR